MLEIGDDIVVFGSRSAVLCTMVDPFEKVVLCAGSNVADHFAVMLPNKIILLGKATLRPRFSLPRSKADTCQKIA